METEDILCRCGGAITLRGTRSGASIWGACEACGQTMAHYAIKVYTSAGTLIKHIETWAEAQRELVITLNCGFDYGTLIKLLELRDDKQEVLSAITL